jgi:hypothetical protein
MNKLKAVSAAVFVIALSGLVGCGKLKSAESARDEARDQSRVLASKNDQLSSAFATIQSTENFFWIIMPLVVRGDQPNLYESAKEACEEASFKIPTSEELAEYLEAQPSEVDKNPESYYVRGNKTDAQVLRNLVCVLPRSKTK